MYFIIRLLGVGLVILLPHSVHAADLEELESHRGHDWVLIKNDAAHHIRSWVRQESGKQIRSFKIEAIMEGSLADYVRVILDFDNYKHWYFEVKEAKLLKKVSDTEYIIYLIHNAPAGTPDRDVILSVAFEPPTEARPYLVGKQKALPDYLPIESSYIRVRSEDVTLKMQVLSENRIQVEAEGFVDPSGHDPAWLVNFFQRSAPYKTFLSISRRLKQIHDEPPTPLPFSLDKALPVNE